jgi:hypothetical protein
MEETGKLQSDGNIIPTLNQFMYLGSTVQENGSSDLEINKKRVVKQEQLLAC